MQGQRRDLTVVLWVHFIIVMKQIRFCEKEKGESAFIV